MTLFSTPHRGEMAFKRPQGPGLGLAGINQPGDLFKVNPMCVGRRFCLPEKVEHSLRAVQEPSSPATLRQMAHEGAEPHPSKPLHT